MVLTVAFQGDRGAFSEAAAQSLLGTELDLRPCRTFDEVFAAVGSAQAQCAVVPIENSLAGSVHRNYELLGVAGLEIAGETLLRIRLALIAAPGAELADLRRVMSHPVALAQCQRFLAAHPHLEAVATYDTAGSVRLVMENGRGDEGAIAGTQAAAVYGAQVVADEIEDHVENYTRFLLLSRSEEAERLRASMGSGRRKTTVLFRTPDSPGALFRALAAFALRDINLTKLESRPIEGRPWEYAFYADVAGDASERNVARALDQLRETCETVIVLGSYVAAEAPAPV